MLKKWFNWFKKNDTEEKVVAFAVFVQNGVAVKKIDLDVYQALPIEEREKEEKILKKQGYTRYDVWLLEENVNRFFSLMLQNNIIEAEKFLIDKFKTRI